MNFRREPPTILCGNFLRPNRLRGHKAPQDLGFFFNLPRNERLRRRSDNAAETSYGRSAAACRRLSGASHPSSQNAYHQKSSRNTQDKKSAGGNRQTAQTLCASIPNRCPANHAHQRRWRPWGVRQLDRDPNDENRNSRAVPWAVYRPTDNAAPLRLLERRTPRDGTVLPWEDAGQATWHRRPLPRG